MKRILHTSVVLSSAILATTAIYTTPKAAAANGNYATATATANAVVVKPLSVSKSQDMDFGSFTINGTGSISSTGLTFNTARVPEGNQQKNAKFLINGANGYSYRVIIPEPMISVIDDKDTEIVVVGPEQGRTLLSGEDTLEIEGILNVDGTENPGTYTSNSFDVNVTYE